MVILSTETKKYKFENSLEELQIMQLSKDAYNFGVSFLDNQKSLVKKTELLSSIYLQNGQIVASEESWDNKLLIGFSDKLEPKIKEGLLRMIDFGEDE